jgi:hypothetical protein
MAELNHQNRNLNDLWLFGEILAL